MIETFGPNSRITFPYRNIERLRDRPEATWTTSARATYVYQLLPNAMVATFPDLVLVIDPVDVGHSTVVVYSMVRPDLEPTGFIARGGVEDNEMSAGVQRGLRAGANEFVEFGRHESAIGHFHAALDERPGRMTRPADARAF